MADPPYLWPASVLRPLQIRANPVFFSRSGGTTLGGIRRTTRTDRGHWSIAYGGVPLSTEAQRRAWNSIRTYLAGSAGLLAVPAWSFDTTPWPAGSTQGYDTVTADSDPPFGAGSTYSSPAVEVEMAAAAAIGDTTVTLRLVSGTTSLVGVRFSHQHALYETGTQSDITGDEWTVDVFPAIRAAIPEDAVLDLALPTCLCRLADDSAMDVVLSRGGHDRVDVAFVEAVDYWNDQAE